VDLKSSEIGVGPVGYRLMGVKDTALGRDDYEPGYNRLLGRDDIDLVGRTEPAMTGAGAL